jgi:cytochrome c
VLRALTAMAAMAAIAAVTALAVVTGTARATTADAQFACDKGCYNCHGDPPKRNAPTFSQLAADYARHRDDAVAQARLADGLRAGSLFGGIDAHERLGAADALRLVRWITEGAPTR